jgi:hypothetical protein
MVKYPRKAFTNALVAAKNKSNNHGKHVKDHEKAALNENIPKGHQGLQGSWYYKKKKQEP